MDNGSPFNEFHIKHHGLSRKGRIGKALKQCRHCEVGLLIKILRDGSELGRYLATYFQIIKSDNGHLIWYGHALRDESLHNIGCDLIACDEDCGKLFLHRCNVFT